MNKNVSIFVDKTIESIDTDAINSWKVKFTDGTETYLFAENDGPIGLPQLWVSDTK